MATDRFVEALKGPSRIKYEGADKIPGTDKVRTFFSTSLYSKESDIKTIIANEERAFKSRRKENISESEK